MPFKPGQSGNPLGRPANGVAVAIRNLAGSPEAIAAFVRGVMENEAASMTDRKWAAEFLADRLDGKPTTTSVSQSVVGSIDLGQARATPLPEDWDSLPQAERVAYVKRLKDARGK